jgi:nucleoside-diphosphate-sugar epimerase
VIFVTGATGFLGRVLVDELLKQGHTLRLFVRPTSDISPFQDRSRLEIAVGDITDPASIDQAIQGCQVVVHAAALFRFWSKAGDFEGTNVDGTENILRAAVRHGIKRLILISSIAVIGRPAPGTLITEITPPHPVDPYQKSKWHSEQLAQQITAESGLDIITLRLGALYGPGGHYAFNRLFFEEFLNGWRIQVAGGRHITFPCYVQDAAQGVLAAIRYGRSGEIYNICGDCLLHKELNQIVSHLSGRAAWRINMPKWLMITAASFLEALALLTRREPFYPLNLRTYVFCDWIVDNQKARTELNFCPTSVEEGVKQTLAWYNALASPYARR